MGNDIDTVASDYVDPVRNMRKVPLRDLKPYFGCSVAWSGDGTEILAHDRDLGKLFAELNRRGIADYIIEYLPASDVFDEAADLSGADSDNGVMEARR